MELRSAIAVCRSAYTHVSAHKILPCSSAYNPLQHTKIKRASRLLIIKAESSGDSRFDSEHNMVDADMILLRKRIFELKLEENNEEQELPHDWMNWEKKMYPSYNSLVFYVIAWAQYLLMSARPSVAVAVLSLICLAFPTSVFFAALGGVKCIGDFMANIELTLK